MNWVLIVYLSMPSNYAVVDEFKTRTECLEKHSTYVRALKQAESKMMATCVHKNMFYNVKT